MLHPSHIAIHRPVTTLMVTLALVFLGFISYRELAVQRFPDLTLPAIGYRVYLTEGTWSPEETNELITIPFEKIVAAMPGVREMRSTSMEGSMWGYARFAQGSDMRFRLIDLQDRVNKWINEQEERRIEYQLDLWSTDQVAAELAQVIIEIPPGGEALTALAADRVARRLRSIDGVSRVEVAGNLLPNIALEAEQDPLRAAGFSVDQMLQAINARARGEFWLGTLRIGSDRHEVKLYDPVRNLDDLLAIPLDRQGIHPVGSLTRLGRKVQEDETIYRRNGRKAVEIVVNKERDRNTLRMSRIVRERLAEVQDELPPGFGIRIERDAAEDIEILFSKLTRLAAAGALLSTLVLLLFVKSWRLALIVGLAIPSSIIMTFNLMYAAGLSLNILTLLGLAAGVGMLVDNAIVVVENVFRHSQRTLDPRQAAWEGSREVTYALVISTATTLVVFVPIFYIDDELVIFMKEPALSLVFPIAISLLVAMTLVPMLTSRVIGRRRSPRRSNGRLAWLARLDPWQRPGRPRRRLARELVLFLTKGCLRHPVRLIFTVLLIIFATFIASGLKVAVQSQAGQDETRTIRLYGKLPLNLTLEEADAIFAAKEEQVRSRLAEAPAGEPVIASFASRFDKRGGEIRLNIAKPYRRLPEAEFHAWLNDLVEGDETHGFRFRPFAAATLLQSGGSDLARSFFGGERLLVVGENIHAMIRTAEELKAYLEEQPEIQEAFTQIPTGEAEVVFDPDLDLFRQLQVDVGSLQTLLRARDDRGVATSLVLRDEQQTERRVTVKVIPPESEQRPARARQTLAELRKSRVAMQGGGSIPLENLGVFSVRHTAPAIVKENRQRNISVGFSFTPTLAHPQMEKERQNVLRRIQADLQARRFPPGVSATLAGTLETVGKQQVTFRKLVWLAIAMVYLVMAFFFESLLSPLVILLTLPLAWIGGIWGIILFNTTLDEVAMLGVILLVGLVVNNGILLIDYTRQRRRQGRCRRQRALLEAVSYRLRPIAMTSLTTILGLLPILFARDADREIRSLVSVVIGGMISSALLTLVFIPVMYNVLSVLAERAAGVRARAGERARAGWGAIRNAGGRRRIRSALARVRPPAGAPTPLEIRIETISKIYPVFNRRQLLHLIPSREYAWGSRPPMGNRALDSVSLTIRGGMFGLLGPNGAGKSTLMQILAGLVEPTYGNARVGGLDLRRDRDALRGLISYLPQNFGVYPRLTLNQYLNFFAALHGLRDDARRRRRIDEVAEMVGLLAVRDKPLSQLSGGMRQRAGIAQLLLDPRPIMIVDEPTAGLDPVERVRFRLLLSELARDRIVILSTHIVDDITSSCREIAILNFGQVVYQGDLDGVLTRAAGRVWDLHLPHHAPQPMPNRHVLYKKHVGDQILYHYFAIEPIPGSAAAPPNFEDAYVALLVEHELSLKDRKMSERDGAAGGDRASRPAIRSLIQRPT
ncbi:MAG TPA: efflux RND transporter permease subunit [Candidatus Sumerlaeota bacterium]|nr:efflux RND transporter permease subunit [Candidatus Sumerlaeota bacterium]